MVKTQRGINMTSALIFAGGTGKRMNSKSKPKQFLELYGKPIIIHTIEHFQKCKEVDGIVIVCLESWIPYLEGLVKEFRMEKIISIISGGSTGQESIYKGLQEIHAMQEDSKDAIVLIHDGVRPLITKKLITDCIQAVKEHGSAITVTPVKETVVWLSDEETISDVPQRKKIKFARAPQCFYLMDILNAHECAKRDGIENIVDSASLMHYYKYPLYIITGPPENIKITTAADFYIFRALYDARENSQIFGL